MDMLDVDNEGFDFMDRAIVGRHRQVYGGPVGLDNLAAAIGEEKDTIEDVLEPLSDPARLSATYTQRADRNSESLRTPFGLERTI